MKVLAIGAHYDDVELGCGGTLLKHKDNGDEIYILVVTESDYSNRSNNHNRFKNDAIREGEATAEFVGAKLIPGDFPTLELKSDKNLINYIIKIVEDVKPDVVYTHFIGDQHLDHKAVAECSLIATRTVDNVYAYVSNIYDTNPVFEPNYFVDISNYFNKKLSLIKIFESEQETHPNWYKQLEYFNGLYGLKQYTSFVEPFKVLRERK